MEIFIAVQALGSGKIIRIVRHLADFNSLEMKETFSEGKQEDYTTVQGAAIIGAAAVGFVAMGPLAPVVLLGGAGVYYYHKYEQTRTEKALKEKETIERMAQRAVASSPTRALVSMNQSGPGLHTAPSSLSLASAPSNPPGAYNHPVPMNPTIPGAASTTYHPPGAGAALEERERQEEGESTSLAARPGAIFSISLSVHLAAVGISLIVEKPVRRWVD
jgi:hypothetical protein